jgi:acetyl esterase/lipase
MTENHAEIDMQGDLPFGEVVNAAGDPETLRLDVYTPAGVAAGPRPAILWFHGGGFRPGNDKRQRYIPLLAKAFAARGYMGIAPDYRVRTDPNADLLSTIRDAVADGRMALAWVRAHAAELGIDLSRLVLAGGSAGGMLITNLVHDPTCSLGEIGAVIDLWGTPSSSQRLFTRISPTCPPTQIVHGTADVLVPYANSTAFAAEMAQAGIRCDLLTLPDAPHTPLMHADQIIVTVADFLTQTVG